MISKELRKTFIEELKKEGNIYFACTKTNIGRATFYRWIKNKEFKKVANDALMIGRENGVDIAEFSLLNLVKRGDLGAIKYYLPHNSSRYKGNNVSKVILVHKVQNQQEKFVRQKTLKQCIDERRAELIRRAELERRERLITTNHQFLSDSEDS